MRDANVRDCAAIMKYFAFLEEELKKPVDEMRNMVKAIYEPFTDDEISAMVSELVRPVESTWKGGIEVIFETVEDMHEAIPNHNGDWYFTGNYPTPGGYKIVNMAFIGYMENDEDRPYDMLL